MADPIPRRPPLPLVQTFIACQQLFCDERTGQAILIGPYSHLGITHFPTHVRMSLFVELTGGHGFYQERFCLRDSDEEEVWGWTLKDSLEYNDPLFPHRRLLFDLMVAVPRVGRYRLVMLLNGEEAAQRSMWFGPSEAFRAPR